MLKELKKEPSKEEEEKEEDAVKLLKGTMPRIKKQSN